MEHNETSIVSESEKPDLLYFFIHGKRLEELYKKLFTENDINMPFTSAMTEYDVNEENYDYTTTSSKFIEIPLKIKCYISDINIKIKNGILESFETSIYDTNSNSKENNYVLNTGFRFLMLNRKTNVKIDDLLNLSEYLNINKSVTCNVTCRFFVIDRINDSIFERYKNQFEIDNTKEKKVFIGDDFIPYTNNKNLLNLITNTEIILLPCLHGVNNNACSYNNDVISENCSIFAGKNIDTGLYTEFYGDDKVRRLSYIYHSNRGHCRDTNIISLVLNKFYSKITRIKGDGEDYRESHAGGRRNPTKKTKKTKKTRKPRKKSRKSRKHKKSRKH